MLNFSGTSKKRVVNLGDKKSSRGANFLERTRLERIQREEARQREKCAILIQQYIRRRLDLLSQAEEFRKHWSDGNAKNWLVWAGEFAFICKFGLRDDANSLLPELRSGIDRLGGDLADRLVALLIGAIGLLLARKGDSEQKLACLKALITTYGVPNHQTRKWSGITTVLQSYVGTPLELDAVDLIFRLSLLEDTGPLIRFVGSTELNTFGSSDTNADLLESALAQPQSLDIVSALPDKQKVQLLVNLLTLKPPPYSTEDYTIHLRILSTMNFSIKLQSDLNNEELVQESQLDTDPTDVSREVYINQEQADVLLVLHSSAYVSHAFDRLERSEKDSVQFISMVMFLFPEARTKLCMMMTITPGLDHWMFDQMSSHPAYIEFRRQELLTDALSSEDFAKVLAHDDISLFLNLLHTYEQLLSYWMIVANDIESASEERFSESDILDFSHFLKVFCLTLIFRSNEIKLANFKALSLPRLTSISISLLNQLYIRNLRLKHLPKEFWKLKSIKFETDQMIQIVLDDEEYKRENEDLSSDEEASRRPSFSRSKIRNLDVTSKLEVLNKVPFFVDFNDRVKVFQGLIDSDQERISSTLGWSFFRDPTGDKLAADIYRESMLESSFEQFHKTGSQFKNKLQVTFYNEHGVEAGIDGGGLTKEFLSSVVAEGFNPENELHLFRETTAENELYPNDDIYLKILKRVDLPTQQKRLQYMKFMGMIVGKCLYESVLIDVAFAPFFLTKWRVAQNSTKNSINDLKYLDRDLYQNLNKLLEMSEDQILQLDLDFTINEQVDSKTMQYDLQPPYGDSIKVTSSNRLNYIHQIANFKLNQSLHIQTKYFLEGLFEIINATWLNMFDPFELQMLISGGNDIDINDWKTNVLYGGYFDDDITVTLFWEVVEEMTPNERCDLIKFVTSVSRAPLLGFCALSPKFGIHNSGASERLPTASTCVNLLKLPDYKDKTMIREKLLYSISANSGFDLS